MCVCVCVRACVCVRECVCMCVFILLVMLKRLNAQVSAAKVKYKEAKVSAPSKQATN